MNNTEALNKYQQLAAVRLSTASNQSATYDNGRNNNGVGATLTYAVGAVTIDGVALALHDYVLLAGQTAAYQNGIYQCTQIGTASQACVLQRRGDFQCREQLMGGQFVPVSAGNVFGGTIFTLVEPLPAAIGNPSTLNANNINFSATAEQDDSRGSGTVSAGQVTINTKFGTITSADLSSIGPGGASTFLLLNNLIGTNSIVLTSVEYGGTNTTSPYSFTAEAPTAGSIRFDIQNWNASVNLNGTLKVKFGVF